MSNLKRLIALVLALCLTLSMTAIPTFAAGTHEVDFDTQLQLGENNLTLLTTADATVYEFYPTEPGNYRFEVNDQNALVGYYGGGAYFTFDQTENKTYFLERNHEQVGPSIMIGVSGVESCVLTVTKIGDAVSVNPLTEDHKNKVTPQPFTLPSEETPVYVKVTDSQTDSAVLGDDGHYHLNTADGPVLFVNLTGSVPSGANNSLLTLATNGLKAGVYDENGKVIKLINYYDALQEYVACIDSKYGVYPLTADLIQILQHCGEYKGWYDIDMEFGSYNFVGSVNKEDAWMFCCSYISSLTSLPAFPEPDPEPVPGDSSDNPIVLTDISEIKLSLTEENSLNGVWYQYTAAEDGTLKMAFEYTSANAVYLDAYINTIKEYPDFWDDGSVLTVDAAANDVIYIKIYMPEGGASEVTINGSFTAKGSEPEEIDPIEVSGLLMETDPVPAGGSLTYNIYAMGSYDMVIKDADAYIIYNGVTYNAVNGIVSVPVAFNSMMATTIVIGNNGSAEEAYTIEYIVPAGSYDNPAALVIGDNTANTAGGGSPYCFTWTAAEDGELTISIDTTVSSDWTYCIEIQYADGRPNYNGDTHYSDAEEVVASETVSVSEGDIVKVIIGTASFEAGEVVVNASFLGLPGSESNPIWFNVPEDTITIGAGETVYYTGRVGDMIVTLEGENVSVLHNGGTYTSANGVVSLTAVQESMWAPAVFAITNHTQAEATYKVSFAFPSGHLDNPAQLIIGENVTIIEKNSSGYFYTWTAEEEGDLTISIDSSVYTDWTYAVDVERADGTYKYGNTHYSDETEIVDSETVTLKEGDVVKIVVGTASYNAGEIALNVSFKGLPGSESNPIPFTPDEIANGTTITIDADETVYYIGRVGDMIVTLEGENVTVLHNGGTYTSVNGVVTLTAVQASQYEPAMFAITNKANTEATFTVSFAYPVGNMENPAELVIGENTAVCEEGGNGYYFTWTAEEDGTLTITMPEGNWTYTINNMTTYSYGETQWSDSDPVVNPAIVEVSEGDELQIIVNTYDPANMWSNPAGELVIDASFEATPGSENNPISFVLPEDTITIGAGETVYYTGRVAGMIMTLNGENVSVAHNGNTYTAQNGVITLTAVQTSFWEPPVFAITNNANTEATYTVSFAYPVGNMENPAELVIGENTAVCEEGGNGYYFTWTAEEDGTLTITMPEGNWTYTINNMTTYSYGETQWSDSDPVVNPAIVEVSEGDELQIIVNTYDPANMWSNPAGELVIDASFEATPGSENNPISFVLPEDTITIGAGETVYYTGRVAGMIMTLNGENVSVAHNGNTYTAQNGVITLTAVQASFWEPPVFAITNNANTEATYTVSFAYPVGNMENPAELVIGKNTAVCEEGGNGYYFTWTADEDGTLTITMPEGNWTYTINNMTTYSYGETQWSDSDPVVNPAIAEVSEGDELQIIVNTYDPANMWSNPAGELVIDASFEATPGSENNPISFVLPEDTITIGAGETVYYTGRVAGMIMALNGENVSVAHNGNTYTAQNGVITLTAVQASFWEPPVFAITNNANTEATYTVSFAYPVGNMENPAELVIGENTAVCEEGGNGYYFTWTADEDGTLTITMPEGNWTYTINNMTTYSYGETQWSDSDPVVNPAIAEVSEGDELQIIVNTYDPANMWSNPAGELVIDASFVADTAPDIGADLGDANGDGTIDFSDAVLVLEYSAFLIDGAQIDLSVSDVNGDNVVDFSDAVLILEYSAFLIDKFPASDNA